MNYFAHGRHYTHDPYFMAGTCVPDWLGVLDRRNRARSRVAKTLFDDADPIVAALARGVAQHHADDAWFHETPAFFALQATLTTIVRGVLPADDRHRPSFLGHILIELLLDSELITENPGGLANYYAALDGLDPAIVAAAVNRITPRPVERLAEFIPRFSAERFLSDYPEDAKLWFRLNQVMRRVKLPDLPREFLDILPEARTLVRARRVELLTPPVEMSK
jgi:hypothetical protein